MSVFERVGERVGIVTRWGWREIGDVSTGMCRKKPVNKKPVNTPGWKPHIDQTRKEARVLEGVEKTSK